MPLYEYHCPDCKKNFEFLQKISEKPKQKCPKCGEKLKKLVSKSAFHLKGTGWYKTDYTAKSKKEKKEEEKARSDKPKEPKDKCANCPIKKTGDSH